MTETPESQPAETEPTQPQNGKSIFFANIIRKLKNIFGF